MNRFNLGRVRGDKGEQGVPGQNATVEIEETRTGAEGTLASVVNVGTSAAAKLVFTIPRGNTGAKGDTGLVGPVGPTGPAAMVKVGSTTTGAAGTGAKVENSGTQGNAVLNFTVPKGEKGDTGAQGPKGEKGDTGAQGPAGSDASVNAGAGIDITGSTISVKFGNTQGTAAQGDDARLSNSREWSADTIPQAEAEAGTASTRRAWTAQRVRQAINAWWQIVTSGFGRNFIAASNEQAARNVLQLGTAATRDVGTATGNVMQVGAFGVGRTSWDGAIEVVDFDNFDMPTGLAVFNTGSLNRPVGVNNGTVFIQAYRIGMGARYVSQIIVPNADHQANNLYIRRYEGRINSWRDWEIVTTSGNILTTTGQSTEYPMSQKAVTDALAHGTVEQVIDAPSGAVAGMYYPLLFKISSNPENISIVTQSATGSYPMNNNSFIGSIAAGGWTDAAKYIIGNFHRYSALEKAIHSAWSGTETQGCFVFFVEARAFPVKVRTSRSVEVITSGSDITYLGATIRAGVPDPSSANHIKLGVRSQFDRGNGLYLDSHVVVNTGNILTTTGQSTSFPMSQKAVTDAINARGFADASGVLTATSGALSNDMSSFLSSLTFAEMRSKLDVISKQSVQALDPDTATLPDLIRALQAP